MRRLGFALGVILLIAAASTGVAQLLSMAAESGYRPVSIGSIWYSVNGNTLVGFQGLVEKGIDPSAWGPIQYFLTIPAWITLGLPGLLLFFACRGRSRGFDAF